MMQRITGLFVAGAFALGLVGVFVPVHASVLTVNGTTLSGNLTAGQGGTARLEWTVESDQGLGTTVTSQAGEFRAGSPSGPVIGSLNQSLQGTTDTQGLNVTIATLTERVTVPQQVALRAQAENVNRIFVVRSFDDGGGSSSGNTAVALTGGLGGEFRLTRIALRFQDGSVQQVAAPESELGATASITFSGSGRLEGRWEIAQPSSTLGEPRFRSIGVVRRQLVGAGREVQLRSPRLPTGDTGIYLLRLRITNPAPDFEPPEIGYAISEEIARVPSPAMIEDLQPPRGMTWEPGMQFGWSGIEGAVAYRVELHERDAVDERAAPVSGVLITAPASEAELSRLALSHLPGGRQYWWRVLAFDARGNVIGRSPLRPLRMPETAE